MRIYILPIRCRYRSCWNPGIFFFAVTQHVDRLDLIPMFLFSLEVFRLGSGS